MLAFLKYQFNQTIYLCKVKLVTLLEGDPKAPFSIATTPRCRGGHYSIPWNVYVFKYKNVLTIQKNNFKKYSL